MIVATAALGGSLFADSPVPQTALSLFDSYLAQEAPVEPCYRTDLRAGGDPGHVPPGRFFAVGPMIGPFTYRAKTYGELTVEERAAVLHDPRFRAFLIATRVQEDRPPSWKSGARSLHPAQERLVLTPEEMLENRPVLVVLARP